MAFEKSVNMGYREGIYEHVNSSSESLIEDHVSSNLRNKNHEHRRWGIWAIHIGILLVNSLLGIVLIRNIRLQDHQPMSLHAMSPAREAVEYETTYFDKYGHLSSPFSTKPGPELDAAWHKQLSGMNIRVPEEWLTPFGAESVHLADGSGVLVQLGVYHELHCLKKLKHWIYRSYYNGNTSVVEDNEEEAHVEHCLEWLRVAALCRGDTTLTTFQWGGKSKSSLETEYPIPRQCVNSEKLLRWSEDRAVDITQKGILKGP